MIKLLPRGALYLMLQNRLYRREIVHNERGLELVTRLGDTLGRRGTARITLIEKGRTHLWRPLLHAIAAGSMDPGGHESITSRKRTVITSVIALAR